MTREASSSRHRISPARRSTRLARAGATTCAFTPPCRTCSRSLAAHSAGCRALHLRLLPDLDSGRAPFRLRERATLAVLSALDKRSISSSPTRPGADASVIVTADHGFIDAPCERVICLDDHPRLAGWLAHPLSGERRAAYCHVQPAHRVGLADYVRENLAHAVGCMPARI